MQVLAVPLGCLHVEFAPRSAAVVCRSSLNWGPEVWVEINACGCGLTALPWGSQGWPRCHTTTTAAAIPERNTC